MRHPIFSSITNAIFSENQRGKTVKKNIIGSLLIKGVSIAISLLIVPITLNFMDKEMYGIWLTISSIVVWLNFLDIGFTLGLKNKLTEAVSLNDYTKGRNLVSTTYILLVLIFIPIAIILFFSVSLLNWSSILNVEAKYNYDIVITMKALSVFFCLQMILNTITSVLAAFQKVAFSSLISVIGQAFSLLTVYTLTKIASPSLLYLSYAVSAIPIIIFLLASLFLYRSGRLKLVAPSIYCFERSLVHELLNLGVKYFLIQIQIVVFYQSTNFLISNIAGAAYVTEYNIAYKYLGVAIMLFSIILTPLWPAYTEAYTQKDFPWMRKTYWKLTRLFAILTASVIVMMILANYIYRIWVGSNVSVSYAMTLSVGIYVILHSWMTMQAQLINGIGTIKLQTYVTLIGLLFHIPLSLFLGKLLGSTGVILSMIIIESIYCTFFTLQINKIISNRAKGIWLA